MTWADICSSRVTWSRVRPSKNNCRTVRTCPGAAAAIGAPAGFGEHDVGSAAVVGAALPRDEAAALHPDWEYAALALSGAVAVDGLPLPAGPLLYLGSGRSDLPLRADEPGRVLLIGGEPFDEQIVMWWNFVGRDHDEIVEARDEWMNGERLGIVRGYAATRPAAHAHHPAQTPRPTPVDRSLGSAARSTVPRGRGRHRRSAGSAAADGFPGSVRERGTSTGAPSVS